MKIPLGVAKELKPYTRGFLLLVIVIFRISCRVSIMKCIFHIENSEEGNRCSELSLLLLS